MRKIAALLLVLALLASCSKKEVKPEEAFDPEKEFAEATQLIEKKKYEEGRDKLKEIKLRDLERKYVPLAELKVADSYLQEKEYELAVSEYKRFLDSYPTHKYAPYAQYQIAITYYRQIIDKERGLWAARKSVEELERLKRLYPRNPYRDTVELYIERGRQIIADHEFMVGEFYFRKKAYSGALTRFLGLLEKFPGYRKEDEVLSHIAISYKKLGESDKAESYLRQLRDRYPGSESVEEAQEVVEGS
jgi:outer membrane protein assembly factor BamD